MKYSLLALLVAPAIAYGDTTLYTRYPVTGSVIGAPVINGSPPSILFIDGLGNLGEDNSYFVWDDINHRMGVGLGSPTNTLDVKGSVVVGSGYAGSLFGPTDGMLIQGVLGLGLGAPINTLDVSGAGVGGVAVGSYAGSNAAPAGGIITSGSVGIGTNNPSKTLEVNGTGKISTSLVVPLIYPAANGTSAIQFDKADGTTNVLNIDTTNSRVGIGSATPGKTLDVVGTGKISTSLVTPLIFPAANSTTAIQFDKADGTTNVVDIDTTNTRVGIATTAPSAALDVNGQIRMRTGATANYTLQGDANGLATWVAQNAPPLLTQSWNMNILNNGTTPNTKIDIKGGFYGSTYEFITENTSSPPTTYRAVVSSTITINTGVVGVNGIDAGTQAASTWYYIWGIYNGVTVSGLASTSTSAPTMPGGYTFKALLGAARSNGSTAFLKFNQMDKRVGSTLVNALTGGSQQGSWTSVSLTSVVPAMARIVSGFMGITSGCCGGGMSVAGDANGTDERVIMHHSDDSLGNLYNGIDTPTADNFSVQMPQSTVWRNYNGYADTFSVLLATSQTLYYQTVTNPTFFNGGNASTSNYRIDITGWEY